MSSEQLRVSIYRCIPDLAGDKLEGLTKFIADEFKKEHGVSVKVEATANPYDLNKLRSVYLADGEDSYDVMEVETVLLGELVRSGHLQPLEDYFTVTEDIYASSAVLSVSYSLHLKDHLYAVPTLQCASFLMELADVDYTPKSLLLHDCKSFDQLKDALDRADEKSCRIILAGDFQEDFKLYLDLHVEKHGKGLVCDDISDPVNDPKEIVWKESTDSGQLESRHNAADTVEQFCDQQDLMREVSKSQHVLMYAYSESMGEALQKAAEGKRHKHALRIISPPLDDCNSSLIYTDAVVVNKSKFADPQRAKSIIKFVEFYTSLSFRTKFAFGRDLPQSFMYPRYVLPALNAFFTETAAAEDECYREFHAALKHAVSIPIHDIYGKWKSLQVRLKKTFGDFCRAQTVTD